MVQHWRRKGGRGARTSALVNGAGALATGITLIVVAISKFSEGAWLTVVVLPLMVFSFTRVNRHYRRVARAIATIDPLELPTPQPPIAVVAAGAWSKMTQQALKFALRLTTDVYVVQIRTERDAIEDLADSWDLLIGNPARTAGIPVPKRVTLTSDIREFFKPFVEFVLQLERDNPTKDIVVVIPDLVMTHWYEHILHNNRGAFLRTILRLRSGPRTVVVNTPFRLQD
jgi:hypothetical protein